MKHQTVTKIVQAEKAAESRSAVREPACRPSGAAHLMQLQRSLGNRTLGRFLQAKLNAAAPARTGLLQRKCACGNHTIAGGECAECAKKKSKLQRKLTIGASNDPMEREADRVADQVLAAPTRSAVSAAPPRIQRLSGQPAGQVDATPASVDRALASPGRPLELALRRDMEQRFGHNFSRVRVHSGAVAEQSARDVNANAYTVGHNIVFGASRFKPGTHEGRRLIAHELTHVLQQSSPGRRASHIQREAASKAEQGTSNQYLDAVLAFLKTPDVEPDYVSALAVLNGISMKGILDILSELKLRGLLNTLLDHYADNQKIFVIRIYVAIHAVLESGKTTRDDFRAKFYYELKELPEDQQSLILDKFPKEQTKKLISQSKALNDAKLRLGLGPVTDKALSDSVSVKGEENPDPNTANQEVEFSGPSVGLTPEDQLIVGRIIHYSDPEGMGFISKYERGTEAQLEQRQQDADMAGNAQESQRFQMVGAGIVGGLAQARATSEANQQATSQSGQPTYEPKIGANKPAPPRYGGLVPPKPGEISTMGGFQDEMEVARLTGGRLARESKVNAGGVVKDLKVRFTRPNGQQGAVEVDVVGPNNELILVGGPAKAGNLSETIERLKSLKIAADQKGVKGVAYFTSDTPTDLLNRAGNILGSDNVRPFQRPTYKVPTQR